MDNKRSNFRLQGQSTACLGLPTLNEKDFCVDNCGENQEVSGICWYT